MILVFDMDDTLVQTHDLMCTLLKRKGIPTTEHYLTNENTSGKLQEILDNPETYMADVDFYDGVLETLDYLVAHQGHRIAICTHRGFHAQGRTLTQDFLDSHDVPYQNLFVLDPNTHPCKMAFLDAVYGEGQYVLIDDRPNFTNVYKPIPNLILHDKPWNTHIEAPRILKFEDLPNLLSYVIVD